MSRRIHFIARSGRLLKKGGSPSTISITIIPKDHISTCKERDMVKRGTEGTVKPHDATTSDPSLK